MSSTTNQETSGFRQSPLTHSTTDNNTSSYNERFNTNPTNRPSHTYRGPIRNNLGQSNIRDRSRSRFDKDPPYSSYNSGNRGGGRGGGRGRGSYYSYNKPRHVNRPFQRDRSRSRSRSRSRDRDRRDNFLDNRDRYRDRSRDRSRERRHPDAARDDNQPRQDEYSSPNKERIHDSPYDSPKETSTPQRNSNHASPKPGLLSSPRSESKFLTSPHTNDTQSPAQELKPTNTSQPNPQTPSQDSPRSSTLHEVTTALTGSPRVISNTQQITSISNSNQITAAPATEGSPRQASSIIDESLRTSSTQPPQVVNSILKEAITPRTPDRKDRQRDDLSPLKPFLSRRGSLDFHSRHHSSSPKTNSTQNPSKPSPRVRRPSDSDEKHHRRKNVDGEVKKEPILVEPLLEPPKPKDEDEVKQRPRLGWGQGLASSPSATAGGTSAGMKRPRMGWGMGLVVTQVPSPKVDNLSAQVDIGQTLGSEPVSQQDTKPVNEDTLRPPSPEQVDMEIDSIPDEDHHGNKSQTNESVERESEQEPQLQRKEDILASIDCLDSEISLIKQELAAAHESCIAQTSNPEADDTMAKITHEPALTSPSKKIRPVLVDPALMETVKKMMDANQTKANAAKSLIEKLGTVKTIYSQPDEFPGYKETISRARVMEERITIRVRRQKQTHYEAMKSLATEYVSMKRAWRIKVKKLEKDRKKREKQTKIKSKLPRSEDGEKTTEERNCATSDAQQINHLRSSSRLTNNSSTPLTQMSLLKQSVDVEKEKQAQLWDQENRRKRLKNAMVSSGASTSPYVIPDMILDEELVRVKNFIQLPRSYRTGMERTDEEAENGMHYLVAEKLKNPWNDIEKCIFIDKFLQTPKNFYRIASFLQNKSTGDVISFYYQTKKVLDYKAIIREQQLRRRGAGIKNTWNCWQLSLCAAMALGVKFPDALHSNLLQHSKFRSHQAAHSILQAAATIESTNSKMEEEDEPMVFNLMDFLDDNMYTTGYELTAKSVRSRFDTFRASNEYQPDPPPSLTSYTLKRQRNDKDGMETNSPQAIRRKATTPRPNLKQPGKKQKSRLFPIKKTDDEIINNNSPISLKSRKEDINGPSSPDIPSYLPLTTMGSTILAPMPIPLTPRTTPTSLNSSLFIPSNNINHLPPGKRVVQKWTEQEKCDFLKYFSIYGKDWTALTNSIPSKTAAQIKNYYQNYKNRLGLQDMLKKRTDRTPGSGTNTPRDGIHEKSPIKNTNSPSNTTTRSNFTFPLSIQVPQEYTTTMSANQHRLVQLQKELSRVQMQQIPSTMNPTYAPSQGSQLKLIQYTLQQQVQMLQMQMHQQSVQDNTIQTTYPRMNQGHERYHSDYYDRFKEETNLNDTTQLNRHHTEQISNLPPLDPPTTTVPSVPSRMSFSSILNESVASPQYSNSPSNVSVPSTRINRTSMSSILNRQGESPVATKQVFSKLQPPTSTVRTNSSYPNGGIFHPVHHRSIYHDHHHEQQPSIYHHHQPIQPVQQHPSIHPPLQPMQSTSIHQPIQPMPQSILQPIQPMQHTRHNVPIYGHRSMEEWSSNEHLRYDEHRQTALEKEAHLRVAQEEAVVAAANAVAAVARVEALQRNAGRKDTIHLAPPRFPTQLTPQPFHLPRSLEPRNPTPSMSPTHEKTER